ncbi:MerR family transcriptional regulator [Algoriphagus machipongonensis]|uniref:Probable transcriptional regulator, MerR family n=1 Tax=Algoriphagus machipongonensis TaxID=388413 RepID=A3HUA5_9BACT|nr:MerR family transcriptional regulator [Algoriphagus machipongonensis]EAZ81727.2 probable transcriptional regulator, MerR family [Algoriphagus machipongonensis]
MSRYLIKDLENLSGIKAHTLRIWEQRYNLLCPKRTDTNIRYYDEADLKLILNVALLNEKGHKISKIASMTPECISEEVIKLTDRSLMHDDQIHSLTICMIEMDEEKFEKILTTNIIKLGFEQTMLHVIYPFLTKIGVLWQTGAINPAQEHFISNLVRQKLIVAIDGQVPSSDGKKFMLFLPEGELHEISLLFATYLIKSKGHKVIYLGQSTPKKDLDAVYELHAPEFLLTVVTSVPVGDQANNYVEKLARKFNEATLLVSGIQILDKEYTFSPNVHLLHNINDLKAQLESLEQVPIEK